MIERIVVPLDGSSAAEQALDEAKMLASLAKAPLHLLRIIDYTRMETYGPYGMEMEITSLTPVIAEEEEAATTYLKQLQVQLQQEGFAADFEIRRGHVTREIVLATGPGDVITMASHGRGGLTRFLLGSVAEDVVRNAEVPVMLIRVDHDKNANSSKNPEVKG